MSTNQKVVCGAALAIGVVFVTKDYFRIRREQTAIRANILVETSTQIAAIQQAERVVSEKIWNGEYDNKSLADIVTDLKFETIVAREEEK